MRSRWGNLRERMRVLDCVAGPARRLRARLQEVRRGWAQGAERAPRTFECRFCSPLLDAFGLCAGSSRVASLRDDGARLIVLGRKQNDISVAFP
jgi:hypothetical protein